MKALYFLACCLVSGATLAQNAEAESPEPLPQPLTLDYALGKVAQEHPNIAAAEARVQQGEAALAAEDSQNGLRIDAEGRVRWVGLSTSPEVMTQDHSVGLAVRKRIYDFGYSSAGYQAASAQLESIRLQFMSVRAQHHLLIMRLYFDVILADMVFLRENERMATVFVQLDRLRERRKLGQASDIQVLEKETEYQKTRLAWRTSETYQRITRARLAQALNRPGQLPAELVRPKLDTHKRQLPELDKLQQMALEQNPDLLALRKRLQASEARVMQARRSGYPSINAELGVNNFTRITPAREDWYVGIVVQVPLFDSGQSRAQVSRAEAEYYEIQAQLRQAEMAVQQAVLDTWADLQQLVIKRDEIWANYDYRELYLDRSRTLYLQEMQTDLGDAMIEITEAQRLVAENDFSFALAWAKLDALTGQLYNRGDVQQGEQP